MTRFSKLGAEARPRASRSDPVSIRRNAMRALAKAYGALLNASADARAPANVRDAMRDARERVGGSLTRLEELTGERLAPDGRTWMAGSDKPEDPADHPCQKAYDAGFAHGKRAAQGRYGRGDAIEAAAKIRAKSYEDSEAYMDGFWNAVHR